MIQNSEVKIGAPDLPAIQALRESHKQSLNPILFNGEVKVFHDKALEYSQLCRHQSVTRQLWPSCSAGSSGKAGEECQTESSGEKEEKCNVG